MGHRARALQDFSYALVKAEMDTDFEDECKEIHRRRLEASDKLKKINKDESKAAKQTPSSPSKMQDFMAIVSTACEICGSKDDEDNMLLCDGCDAGYHTYCVVPPIQTVPPGDWFCPKCLENKEKGGGTPASTESKKGSLRARRRKSRWSSGVVPKKKPSVKKKILDSDEGNEDEEDDDMDVGNSKNNSKNNSNIDPDLTPSSPRPSSSRGTRSVGSPAVAQRPGQVHRQLPHREAREDLHQHGQGNSEIPKP